MRLFELGSQWKLNMNHSTMRPTNAPASNLSYFFHVDELQFVSKQPCGIQKDTLQNTRICYYLMVSMIFWFDKNLLATYSA